MRYTPHSRLPHISPTSMPARLRYSVTQCVTLPLPVPPYFANIRAVNLASTSASVSVSQASVSPGLLPSHRRQRNPPVITAAPLRRSVTQCVTLPLPVPPHFANIRPANLPPSFVPPAAPRLVECNAMRYTPHAAFPRAVVKIRAAKSSRPHPPSTAPPVGRCCNPAGSAPPRSPPPREFSRS